MNVLIVEDEAHTSKLLKELIEHDEDFLVTERVETIAEAIAYLSKHQNKLDLIFLDIELADGQSFEIFNHVDITIPVVFCTAYDEFTMEAIKNNGIDYILKPFKEEEILLALRKYKQLVATFQNKPAKPLQFTTPSQYQQSFLTHYRDKTLVKYVKDIALFQVEHNAVFMYTLDGKKFPLLKSLEYIESVSDPQQFFRINRQCLLNKVAVTSLEPYFKRKMVVQVGFVIPEKLVISRLKVTKFKEWLEGAE